MDELVADFLVETRESLEILDNDVLCLEKTPDDPEILGNIFRVMHTIKGTCGFLGLSRLESIAHAGENVLDKIRNNEIVVRGSVVSAILESIDRIKMLLDHLEEHEEEPTGRDEDLIAKLNKYADPAYAANDDASPAAAPAKEQGPAPSDSDELQTLFDATPAAVEGEIEADEPPSSKKKEEGVVSKDSDILQELFDATPCDINLDAFRYQTKPEEDESEDEAGEPEKKTAKAAQGAAAAKNKEQQAIRVSLDTLEKLMQHASELVLTRNQLMQILRDNENSAFAAALQRLNHITTDLQEHVMKTRMQPIGNAWSKLPRIVRDLSAELGKKIELVMEGEETELDRQLLERIRDPLTHMVRNSADHGIEVPEIRRYTGKPETGTIHLKAYQGGGYIIIEISDDGAGINPSRIRRKAVEKGFVSAQEAETMTDEQAIQFIFMAGFSTAEKVTSVSGRGVGMDVVKNNIEKISGSVNLRSEVGKGSTFVIKIPLTLAIMPILEVETCGLTFALPQINVVEVVKSGAKAESAIEYINDSPVLRLRDNLIPLAYLHEALRIVPDEKSRTDRKYVIVCAMGDTQFGVIVDNVFDTEEIVVKPVAPQLKKLDAYSGCTILGNGKVILILDAVGLARAAGSLGANESTTREEKAEPEEAAQIASFVIFEAGSATPKAVPLELLSRLENVEISRIEYSQGCPVLQYRGDWMKLAAVEGELTLPQEGEIDLLVFGDRGNTVGLVADRILDIVKCPIGKRLEGGMKGYVGSIVVEGKTCDVIDLNCHFDRLFPSDPDPSLVDKSACRGKRLLLVDDSPFFRKFIMRELQGNGFVVESASGCKDALALLEKNPVDVVITDITMPGMSGAELARHLRTNPRFKGIPIIALSSWNADQRAAEAKEFDYFISKTHHSELYGALQRACGGERHG
jgi:two-component system chemotaxis sensor kinase CheA